VREQRDLFNASVVLIEDKASGTQLIQELIAEGCHGVTRYQPTGDKTMRMHAQTAMIENGFVHIPETAPWLAEYLHELTVFPNGKHDDQADSTAQFLDWYKMPFPGQNIFELYRMQAEGLRRRTSSWVRLRVPAGIGSVQTFSGRHIKVGLDGAIEMSADDAQYYIRDGWTKLAEWTRSGLTGMSPHPSVRVCTARRWYRRFRRAPRRHADRHQRAPMLRRADARVQDRLRPTKGVFLYGGTDGSNPVASSGESQRDNDRLAARIQVLTRPTPRSRQRLASTLTSFATNLVLEVSTRR
jgi:hypothetical protein